MYKLSSDTGKSGRRAGKEKQRDLFVFVRLNSALWTEVDVEPVNFAWCIFMSGWFVCVCVRDLLIFYTHLPLLLMFCFVCVCVCIYDKELCSRGSNEALIQQHIFGGVTKKIAQLIPVTLTTAQWSLYALYSPHHFSIFLFYSCKDVAVIIVETRHFFFKHSVTGKQVNWCLLMKAVKPP